LINICCKKITKLLFHFEPVLMKYWVLLKFRIRNSGFEINIQNYSRIPNYSEVTIPKNQ